MYLKNKMIYIQIIGIFLRFLLRAKNMFFRTISIIPSSERGSAISASFVTNIHFYFLIVKIPLQKMLMLCLFILAFYQH